MDDESQPFKTNTIITMEDRTQLTGCTQTPGHRLLVTHRTLPANVRSFVSKIVPRRSSVGWCGTGGAVAFRITVPPVPAGRQGVSRLGAQGCGTLKRCRGD